MHKLLQRSDALLVDLGNHIVRLDALGGCEAFRIDRDNDDGSLVLVET